MGVKFTLQTTALPEKPTKMSPLAGRGFRNQRRVRASRVHTLVPLACNSGCELHTGGNETLFTFPVHEGTCALPPVTLP